MEQTKHMQELLKRLPEEIVLKDEPMKNYTTFKIGGPAKFLVQPRNIEEVKEVIVFCNESKIPYYILGNGSNLLVADEGYEGVVIQVYKNLSNITVDGEYITAEAGALLSRIATQALKSSLTGFEFAHGIPGTLGGAVVMNAGAYGGEIKEVLEEATVMNEQGEILTVNKEALELGYRTSSVMKNNWLVLSAKLKLQKGNEEAISAAMKDFMARRKEKQPLEKPSAGSTFKRPEGYFAGKLIMDAGLRGYKVGGAMVSDKHCGFVVNDGDATCEDVKALIKHVKEVVYEKFGVMLEPEVKELKNK